MTGVSHTPVSFDDNNVCTIDVCDPVTGVRHTPVVIDDGNGYRSVYAHMYKLSVKVGDILKAGAMIGYEGATGHATGCHLHYGLFNPDATGVMGIDPAVWQKMLLPDSEVARIDPQLVFPKLP